MENGRTKILDLLRGVEGFVGYEQACGSVGSDQGVDNRPCRVTGVIYDKDDLVCWEILNEERAEIRIHSLIQTPARANDGHEGCPRWGRSC